MNFNPKELQQIYFLKSPYRSRTASALDANKAIFFKSYVEDVQEQTLMNELPLQASPAVIGIDSMVVKVTKKFRLSFTVMPENRKEAVDNYKKLKNLMEWLRPTYIEEKGQYVPVDRNVFGTLNIMFKGLPIINIPRQITTKSFSYQVNKELGYFVADPDPNKNTFEYSNDDILIPISFKISIEANVNLSKGEILNILSISDSASEALN